MSNQLVRSCLTLLLVAAVLLVLGCTASQEVVYRNPLFRGEIERNLIPDTSLLNPGADSHPYRVDLTHWLSEGVPEGADSVVYLESYPRSDIDSMYHPSEYVGAAHPIYHLSGSEEGRITEIFLSDDSTYIIEPMAYSFNRYQMEFMVPYRNEVGFKTGNIQLAWIDSLTCKRVIDRTPEARELIRYSVLGGLMMFLLIGAQNGLF